MNKVIKNALLWGSAFVAYRLYKLYELGNSIIYKPVGVTFKRGATINDFIIRVKMEILNPQNTVLKLRGIDGILSITGQPIGAFASEPFDIQGGLNYFFLDFKVDPKNVGAEFIKALLSKKVPIMSVKMNVKLPFFTVINTFDVNLSTVPNTETYVK